MKSRRRSFAAMAGQAPQKDLVMVWFYERQGAFIRCETRNAASGSGFELVVIQPDGSERVEHFDDSAALARRQAELENTLTHDGWAGPFGRTI